MAAYLLSTRTVEWDVNNSIVEDMELKTAQRAVQRTWQYNQATFAYLIVSSRKN